MAFCGYLKQSTVVTIMLGPFVDEDDGKTAEVGLTITQADVRLSKNGANMAQKTDANAAVHDEIGIYSCQLDATDTGTLGILDVMVHESGALPVHQSYQVVVAHWYDTMCSTDYLQVDVVEISGDAAAANNAESFFDGTGYAGTNNVMPTTTTVTNQVTADVTAISGDAAAANNAESFFDGTGYAGTNNVMPTTTTVTNQVTADVTAISGDAGAADNAESFFDGTGYAGTNNVIPTVTTLTGHTAQTGDNFARLGAPAGASVSADVAAVKAETTLIVADTGTDGVVISTATAQAIGDELLKRDWTAVAGEAARSVLNALRFLRNKWSISAGVLTVTEEDDTTAAWTATITDDAAADNIVSVDPA